jgi:phenylalanyl-tRNA synthetase alpha chain
MLEAAPSLQHSQLTMALGWLLTKGILAVIEERRQEFISLTETGEGYATAEIPVLRMLGEIRRRGQLPIRELQGWTNMEPEEKSSAIGALKESGAVRVISGGLLEAGDPGRSRPFEELQSLILRLRDRLKDRKGPIPWEELSATDREMISAHHRKRGKGKGIFRIDERVDRVYAATPLFDEIDSSISDEEVRQEYGQLTPEMLKEESWRNRNPRKYNIQLRPGRIAVGRKHPYREFLDFVKEKLVAMGFEEMRGPLVESEFWDMDALFMPQFHPARDIHDVYYVKSPAYTESLDEALVERVAAAHRGGREGGKPNQKTGSRGWRYPFDPERTRRLVLRSQGTAVSARTLAGDPKIPGKYFSIARCFRYDQVDATHAPDFFQVEGIVLGEGIHFRTLLGLLVLFAREVARAGEVKFLPAYFPFTEPSVEMHARHPDLGWMELGGAGLFRPEVTRPLGVDVPVIAWGLGLDRMAMLALGISDIRDLFSGDLELIRQKRI